MNLILVRQAQNTAKSQGKFYCFNSITQTISDSASYYSCSARNTEKKSKWRNTGLEHYWMITVFHTSKGEKLMRNISVYFLNVF